MSKLFEMTGKARLALTPVPEPEGGIPKLTKDERKLLASHDAEHEVSFTSRTKAERVAVARMEIRGLTKDGSLTEYGHEIRTHLQESNRRAEGGIPIAEYKPPKRTKLEIPDTRFGGLGWFVAEVNNAQWFSNGEIMFKGEPPESIVSKKKPDLQCVLDQETPSMGKQVTITPIAFRDAGMGSRFIHFSTEVAIQARYYDYIIHTFGDNLEWRQQTEKDTPPVVVYKDDEPVGVIMSIRDITTLGIEAIRNQDKET